MLQMFSLTESSAAGTVLPNADALRKVGSAGIPIIHGGLKIADDDDNEVPVGEVGEILLSGPHVMAGYWNNPEASIAALRGGWLHTGDVGFIDADGHLTVVDRVKELIKVKGFQVAPAELEALLLTHPAVADAAVIGIPDDEAGELPRAFIVLKPGQEIEAADITDFTRQHVATYKVVHDVVFTDAIPKSPSGKILRRMLRDQGA